MTATTGGRDMSNNGESFTYAGPHRPEKDETPKVREAFGPSPYQFDKATRPDLFMVAAPDRARVIGTEALADGLRLGQAGSGERKFTRAEIVAVLKSRKVGCHGSFVQPVTELNDLISIFENME